MESTSSRLEKNLVFIALALGISLLLASIPAERPWSDLLIGMSTSFVFFAVFEAILALQRTVRHRRRRAFFGPEMFENGVWLALADFVLRPEALDALSPALRSQPWCRPPVPGVPHHDHPIMQTNMMCLMDIRALLEVSSELARWCRRSPTIVVDTDAYHDRARSLVASGLTDNHCTAMYLEVDDKPLFTISSHEDVTWVTLANGHQIRNSSKRERAVILRYSPDRDTAPHRRWFIVAGLDEAGSAAAGRFLGSRWSELDKHVDPEDDFVAVLSLPRYAWQHPSLEYVLTRGTDGLLRSTPVALTPEPDETN